MTTETPSTGPGPEAGPGTCRCSRPTLADRLPQPSEAESTDRVPVDHVLVAYRGLPVVTADPRLLLGAAGSDEEAELFTALMEQRFKSFDCPLVEVDGHVISVGYGSSEIRLEPLGDSAWHAAMTRWGWDEHPWSLFSTEHRPAAVRYLDTVEPLQDSLAAVTAARADLTNATDEAFDATVDRAVLDLAAWKNAIDDLDRALGVPRGRGRATQALQAQLQHFDQIRQLVAAADMTRRRGPAWVTPNVVFGVDHAAYNLPAGPMYLLREPSEPGTMAELFDTGELDAIRKTTEEGDTE